MNKRIVYLMSYPAHLPYLVVSLQTLRQHWSGPIDVFAWSESYDLVNRISEESDFNINVYNNNPKYRGKNDQFLHKIKLMQSFDCDIAMYLDADTSIHGNLDLLFDRGLHFGFAATQFNNWMTGPKGVVAARVKRLRDYSKIDQSLVEEILLVKWPSVNGGIWTARPSSPVLPLWYDWTMIAKKIFIADETVLHVLQPKFIPEHKMNVICERGRFNSSPKHKSKELEHNDVVIYHYHGDSNVRPQKSSRGLELWWPMYQEALKNNLGGISDWRKEIKNKWMNILEDPN